MGVEFAGGPIPHTAAIQRLGSLNGFHEDRQSPQVVIRFRTLKPGRQPVHDDACFAGPYEGGSGPDTHSRAASEQNFLESQRAVVIVRQVGTGPRPASGFEQLLASVTAVVDLDVARERFGQVLK